MEPSQPFDVFLSHNGRDKVSVEAIARRLVDEEGLRPWLDRWNLIPGDPWQEAIEGALDNSRTCAVFLGAAGIGAWEHEEMRAALSIRVGRDGFRVIPVLLPGATLPEQMKLPLFLSRLTWVDFRNGLDDRAEFRRLVAGIRGTVPGRSDGESPSPLSARGCPYRGLEVFEEAHARFFFGRESLSQHVIEALLRDRLVAVLGPSGCGKSSMVRAGVIPQLKSGKLPRSETWTYVTLTPGAHPLHALAEGFVGVDPNRNSLTDELKLLKNLESDERALHLHIRRSLREQPKTALCFLFIDQFEEILTLCRDDKEREQFLLNLRYASTITDARVVTVVTMRADFMERAASQRNLAEILSGHQLIVSPMDDSELRRAIEQPAALAGLSFEKGLVELILEDVGREPGALPLLEDALTQLYEHRSAENVASLQTYRALGGVHGALAKRAEEVFEGFTPAEKDIARRVFLRLTQPGEGTADTRRRAELNELWPDPAHQPVVEKVVERLVGSRLLTMNSDPKGTRTAEVAHEALIRGWPRLHGWIEEERESLRVHRRVTEAAREWQARQRDAGLMYRGVRLTEALEFKRKSGSSLNQMEREFIDASSEAVRRETRAARLRRWGAVIAVAVALILGALIFRAYREQQASRLRELVSSVKAFEGTDPELSLRLAIEAAGLSRTPEVESVLRQALSRFPESLVLRGHEGVILSLKYSPRGRKRLVTAGGEGDAYVWDVETGASLKLSGHRGPLNRAIFSPDGEKVLTTSDDGTARIWDAGSGQLLHELLGHGGEVLDADFSPDGKRAVTSSADDTARIWDVESGKELLRLAGHGDDVHRVAFNPDGNTLATVSDDKTARIWDAELGKQLLVLPGHDGAVTGLAYSPRGDLLATASKDKTVRIWDAHTGEPKQLLSGHGGAVNSVAFSPDGTKVVTASDDTSARIWEVQTGRTLPVLLGHSSFIYSALFSPDGRYVVTASADKTTRLWDADTGQMLSLMQGDSAESRYAIFSPAGDYVIAAKANTLWLWKVSMGQPLRLIPGHGDEIWSVAYSPDGKYLVTASGNEGGPDDTARIWVAETGQEFRRLLGHGGYVHSASFSRDGRYVVTACSDHKARIWEVQEEKPPRELDGQGGPVWDAAFSPDGNKVATAHEDKTARIWDAHTGQQQLTLSGHEGIVRSVAFSPDGKYVLTASEDMTARIWDAQTGKNVRSLNGHTSWVIDATFSPDGKYVVTASIDKTARIWDAHAGQPLQVLTGHIGNVTSATFSPDGRFVVTASKDHTVRLWDVRTGEQFSLLRGHNDAVRSAAFSPDGKYIATAGADMVVRIYACEECAPLDELLKLASARNPRQLTAEERRTYRLEK